MRSVRVNLDTRAYSIHIGRNSILKLPDYLTRLDLGSDAFVITNPSVKRLHGRILGDVLKKAHKGVHFELVADSEASKSLQTATRVLKKLGRWGRGKQPFIIAFGGGVIGDLSGFIAAIYKRGIPYIQIPTTLLAQVDSAIGGKTAVDLPEGKNLIGAFYQPRLVVSDISFIGTLNKKQISCGLAEIIKYSLIADEGLFMYLLSHLAEIKRLNTAVLTRVIQRCSAIKADIVSKDECEKKGLRTVLNFGHTIGHAIESAGGYKRYNHGEAVALGMLAASRISYALKMLPLAQKDKITALIAGAGLPARVRGIPPEKIIRAHYSDKKFVAKRNRFVLLPRIGRARVVENIPAKIIREAVKGII